MTAAETFRLNGDMSAGSPVMEAVRRFHALSVSHGLPYCVVGGIAVIRNGYPRTTVDLDILTRRDEWMKLLPLTGDISSEAPDACRDRKTGLRIDVLFAEDDWGMPVAMPDPRVVAEFDDELGGNFIGLHDLVRMKTAVYLTKLRDDGEDVASKDRSDVYELIRRNLSLFSRDIIQAYPPELREHCLAAFEAARKSSPAASS